MKPLRSRLGTPQFRTATTQGQILIEVAALQRGNLDTGFFVEQISFFGDGEARLTAHLPSGDPIEHTASADYFSDSLRQLVQEQKSIRPPLMDSGPHRLVFRGPAKELFTDLLLELGSSADMMVMYRPDIEPLSFSEIWSDGEYATEIVLTDSSHKAYRVRYAWTSVDDSPIVGDMYTIVDAIADGDWEFENPLEMRSP